MITISLLTYILTDLQVFLLMIMFNIVFTMFLKFV
jgi:hypothetical protein